MTELERRKAWALRQGNRLWLWPEVAPPAWRAAMTEIERTCRTVLAGGDPAPLSGDAAAFGLAGYTSGMGPQLGWWIGQGRVAASSPGIAAGFAHQLEANRARMADLLEQARLAIAGLLDAGVAVIVLKGLHTAGAYFPAPACRPMSDIDLLAPAGAAARAEALLREAGYRRIGGSPLESTWRRAGVAVEPRTLLSLEADDPWTIDLHVSLDVPGPPGARRARLSAFDPWTDRAAWAPLPGAGCLPQPALLLHLAAHAGSGFHNLTLVRLLELVLVARQDRAAGVLDWDELVDLGRATESLAFAYPALELARHLAPDAIPQDVAARCAAEAPAGVRRIVAQLAPATAHRIDGRSLREHFAWTRGLGGWCRRLGADLVPHPGSWRDSAAIHAARARGLLRAAARR